MLTVDYRRLALQPDDRLLDIGCGFGRHSFETLLHGADVVSCDLALAELESVATTSRQYAEEGFFAQDLSHTQVQANARTLPFATGSFTKVIAAEVLEHVDDDTPIFAELHRVLTPGGTLVVTVPAYWPEKICWKISSDYHAPAVVGGHVRIYTKKHLRAKLCAAGFTPTESHRAHALHSPYWWLRCLVGINAKVEDNPVVRYYHKLLEWDITQAPWLTRFSEKILNPVLGKSLVVYAQRSASYSEAAVVT